MVAILVVVVALAVVIVALMVLVPRWRPFGPAVVGKCVESGSVDVKPCYLGGDERITDEVPTGKDAGDFCAAVTEAVQLPDGRILTSSYIERDGTFWCLGPR